MQTLPRRRDRSKVVIWVVSHKISQVNLNILLALHLPHLRLCARFSPSGVSGFKDERSAFDCLSPKRRLSSQPNTTRFCLDYPLNASFTCKGGEVTYK